MNVPRPQLTPVAQRRGHFWAAVAWFAFGIFGLVQYLASGGGGVADSIPVLFMISVYANFVGHLSSVQAAQAEIKVDQAVDVDGETVNVENAQTVERD